MNFDLIAVRIPLTHTADGDIATHFPGASVLQTFPGARDVLFLLLPVFSHSKVRKLAVKKSELVGYVRDIQCND